MNTATTTNFAPTIFQDQFSEEIWSTTYKDHNDKDVNDTLGRVAKNIASAETTLDKRQEWEGKFRYLLENFKAVPGGRILANAGTTWGKVTYMNCYTGPLPERDLDSIEGIYAVLKDQANTLKSEGGWGMNFSWIRPRGSFIAGVGVESPGSVRFMELFDKSSEIVTSGSGRASTNKRAKGKIRKGAMMGVLDCSHPDIIEFITAKQTPGRLTKFNVSVNCTDEFMSRVNALQDTSNLSKEEFDRLDTWDLVFPTTSHERYKNEWDGNITLWKSKGYPVDVYRTVSVLWLWNLIMESTYNRNEPGVLFLDRANFYNPLSYAETIKATNPCGEQTLAAGGVCCLGSLNLTQFVNKDRTGFDMEELVKCAKYLVRFLDNVNSISESPLPEYKHSMTEKRRVGCGVMGWGSALFMLKIRFGSAEAQALQKRLMSTYARAAYEASIDLAVEKGRCSYCVPEKHAEAPFVKTLGLDDEYRSRLARYGIRNSALLSQQPTGNTSILANVVSGGIEPVFMPEYIRTVIVNTPPEAIAALTPAFHEGVFEETDLFKWVKEGDDEVLRGVGPDGVVYKIDRNRGLTKEVLCEDYGVRFLKALGEWDSEAEYAVTTNDLRIEDHVTDLEGFSRWTDSACSKTASIPQDYPFEDFKHLYIQVYNTGVIKGFTTYRAGTMASVLAAKDEATATNDEEEIILDDVSMPDSLPATLKTIRSEGRKWYLTVIQNEAQSRPVALFVQTNAHEKSITANDAVEHLLSLAIDKGIPSQHIEDVVAKTASDNNPTKICRMVSLNLRHGVLIKNIVHTLDKVDCFAGSFVFHIRKYLASFIRNGERVEGESCLECGSDQVVYQEGCRICRNCGSGKCG
jgi:ribonucleoside-diphosphate reductase alpha chain